MSRNELAKFYDVGENKLGKMPPPSEMLHPRRKGTLFAAVSFAN